MKKLFAGLLAGLALSAQAQIYPQFVPGQTLTAAQLNQAFAQAVNLSGSVMSGPLSVPSLTVTGSLSINSLTLSTPLGVASGGTGASTASGTSLDNIAGFSGTGFLVRSGAGSYSFTSTAGGVALSSLAPQAANTVVGNSTGVSASPTAITVTGCNGAAQALQWTNGTGFGCNSAIATSGANANITSLSGLSTPLSVAQGGTGVTTSTGTGSNVLSASPTFTGTVSVASLAASGTISGVGFSNYLASPPAIGGTAAAAGSFTTLSASSTVSGTGFSTYLASPPAIGGTVAAAGTFTTVNATTGYTGVTNGSTPGAGFQGENATAGTTGTSMSTGVGANCTSKSFAAGDWLVWGTVFFHPAGTTTVSNIIEGLNTTSATVPGTYGSQQLTATFTTGGAQVLAAPPQLFNLSTTTTIYLVGQATFGTSTMTCDGNIFGIRYN